MENCVAPGLDKFKSVIKSCTVFGQSIFLAKSRCLFSLFIIFAKIPDPYLLFESENPAKKPTLNYIFRMSLTCHFIVCYHPLGCEYFKTHQKIRVFLYWRYQSSS